jgi:uncharacterized protein (DUF302 family)
MFFGMVLLTEIHDTHNLGQKYIREKINLILKTDIFQSCYNQFHHYYSMSATEEGNSSFSYTVKTLKTINQAVEDMTVSLKDVGLGVLCTLDFKEILQKKGLDYKDEYRLLEVCNPSAAKQALESNPEIGLLLPCTIAIYQKNNENFISLAKPTALLANIHDHRLDKFGQEIEQKLVSAIQKMK